MIVGKSSLLSVLGNREVPIPQHLDIFHLQREMPPSEKTALECVMEVDQTRNYLEAEAEELAVKTDDDRKLVVLQTWNTLLLYVVPHVCYISDCCTFGSMYVVSIVALVSCTSYLAYLLYVCLLYLLPIVPHVCCTSGLLCLYVWFTSSSLHLMSVLPHVFCTSGLLYLDLL